MPTPAQFKGAFGLQKGVVLGGYRLAQITMGHEMQVQNERYSFPTTMVFEPVRGAGDEAGSSGDEGQQSEEADEVGDELEGGEGEGADQDQSGGGGGGGAAPEELLRLLKERASEEKIVYSPYGCPYACTFGKLTATPPPAAGRAAGSAAGAGEAVTITCFGAALRSRAVPTLAQQRKQQVEQEAAGSGGAEAAAQQKADVDALKAAATQTGFRVIKSRFGTSKCAGCKETIPPGDLIAKPQAAGGRGGWKHLACCGLEPAAARGGGAESGGGGGAGAKKSGGAGTEGSGDAGGKGRKRARGGAAEAPAGEVAAGKRARAGGKKRG